VVKFVDGPICLAVWHRLRAFYYDIYGHEWGRPTDGRTDKLRYDTIPHFTIAMRGQN